MEKKKHEVKINNCSIFFEELEQLQTPQSTHDSGRLNDGSPLEWTNDMLRQAAQPLVDALGALHQAAQSMAPDELELSMKLELAVRGNTPVFKVISMEGNCQFAAKFVWKNT